MSFRAERPGVVRSAFELLILLSESPLSAAVPGSSVARPVGEDCLPTLIAFPSSYEAVPLAGVAGDSTVCGAIVGKGSLK